MKYHTNYNINGAVQIDNFFPIQIPETEIIFSSTEKNNGNHKKSHDLKQKIIY